MVGFNAARGNAGMATRPKRASAVRPAVSAHRRNPPAVLVVHGPNLNLLGEREPGIYGRTTLVQIDLRLRELGLELGMAVEAFQATSESALVDRLQEARGEIDAVLINPAAHTPTRLPI